MSTNLSGTRGNRIRAFTITSGGGASSARHMNKSSSPPGQGARRTEQFGKNLYQVSELSEIIAEEEKVNGPILQTQPNLILETSGI